jgi:putative membrane protein
MTRVKYVPGFLTVLFAAGCLTSALAATSEPTSQQFVTKASEANLAEIKTSQLALSKSQDAQVRNFAQEMIDDHTKANQELATLAGQKNLKVPDDTDMSHRASMKLLEAKSGASFDKSYIDQMQKDHQKAVALFREASKSSKVDADLKAFATSTLPTLQHHEQSVTKLAAATASGASNR